IEFHRTDGTCRLDVSDDGIGIAAAQRTAVVGSGRSIIHALVKDELGGTIDTQSSSEGTRVRIEFPAARHRGTRGHGGRGVRAARLAAHSHWSRARASGLASIVVRYLRGRVRCPGTGSPRATGWSFAR